jgi:hypothetical protein
MARNEGNGSGVRAANPIEDCRPGSLEGAGRNCEKARTNDQGRNIGEFVVSWRLRSILGSPGTPIQAFDQDAWVAAGRYAKRDARKSLEQFRVLRDANLALYKNLTPQQWKHHDVHAERGEESVERIAQMMAGHDINHLEQVAGILRSKK